MRKLLPLVLMIIATASVTAGAMFFTTSYSQVQTIGPYTTSKIKSDTATGGAAGGDIRIYKNGVDTLIVGDVVYISANNTVRKSTTLANYSTIAGVVVGGTSTNMAAVTSTPAATDTAAKGATAKVLVMARGRTWVRIDAAAGIAPGSLLLPSTTVAGKVKGFGTAIDTFYRSVGRLIDTGIVSTQVLAHISVK